MVLGRREYTVIEIFLEHVGCPEQTILFMTG
jgi:hypothetical protein